MPRRSRVTAIAAKAAPRKENSATPIFNLDRQRFIDESPVFEVRLLLFSGGRIHVSATVMDDGQDVIAGQVIRRVLARHS